MENYFLPRLGLFGACVNAEAATERCAGVDFGLLRILDAFVATVLLVCSFLDFTMGKTPFGGMNCIIA